MPISKIIISVLKTWQYPIPRRPKFHISDQATSHGKSFRKGAHADYVREIPRVLIEISKKIPIDIMVEAKLKELATMRLNHKYLKLKKFTNVINKKKIQMMYWQPKS
jgi:UV DNA damage repair endonuclease